MNAYDHIAWFYNKYWTVEAPKLFYKVFKRFFAGKISAGSNVLDLCCGTGQLAAILSKDYNVTGLDLSEKMLDIARTNAKKADFILADACNFNMNKRFDAVISAFDSINHIMSEDGILSCFKSVKKCLKENGYFLFDINSSDAFDENWNAGFSKVEDDNVCILSPIYDSISHIAEYKITSFFKKNDMWSRSDSVVYERYYPDSVIFNLLSRAGFKNMSLADGGDDLNMPEFSDRHFFLASLG